MMTTSLVISLMSDSFVSLSASSASSDAIAASTCARLATGRASGRTRSDVRWSGARRARSATTSRPSWSRSSGIDQRREEADHVPVGAAREDDDALRDARLRDRGGERGIRLPGRGVDELGGDHRAVAAHVADPRVGGLQVGQAVREDARRSRARARSGRRSRRRRSRRAPRRTRSGCRRRCRRGRRRARHP